MMDIVDRIKEFTLDGAGYNSAHNCMLLDAISEIKSLRAKLAQPTPSQSEDERAEFEKWWPNNIEGAYSSSSRVIKSVMFDIWQARAKLSKPQPTSQDTERLDYLQAQSEHGYGWVARFSGLNRGYRLHQSLSNIHGCSVRKAIDAVMQKEKG